MKVTIEKLLEQGAEIITELNSLQKNAKLSTSAFLKEALAVSGLNRRALKELDDKINAHPHLETIHAYIRSACVSLRENTTPRMPSQLNRVRYLARSGFEGEAAVLGANYFSLFGIAVLRTTRSHPQVFGNIENWDSMLERVAMLEEKKETITHSIESCYTVSDLIFDEPDRDGRVKASFRISDAQVQIGVHCGSRLLTWWVANQETVAT